MTNIPDKSMKIGNTTYTLRDTDNNGKFDTIIKETYYQKSTKERPYPVQENIERHTTYSKNFESRNLSLSRNSGSHVTSYGNEYDYSKEKNTKTSDVILYRQSNGVFAPSNRAK